MVVFRNPNRDQCTMCCDTINFTACKFLAGSFTCQATCVLLCWQCHDEKTINLSRLSITKVRINSTNYHHVKCSKKWGKVIVFLFSHLELNKPPHLMALVWGRKQSLVYLRTWNNCNPTHPERTQRMFKHFVGDFLMLHRAAQVLISFNWIRQNRFSLTAWGLTAPRNSCTMNK